MKKRTIFIMALLFPSLSVTAAKSSDVHVSGIVVNSSLLPIEGVTVSFLNKKFSDTTDSRGVFIISTITGKKHPAPQAPDPIGSRRNSLSIYELRGRKIESIGEFENGMAETRGLKISDLPPGVYFVTSNNGPFLTTRRFIKNGTIHLHDVVSKTARHAALQKRASAVCDTLSFEKIGYLRKKMAITGCFDTLDTVKLDTALPQPFPVRQPVGVKKVLEMEPGYIYMARTIWDIDYVCDCRKTILGAEIYIQVSPVDEDTFHFPSWSGSHYRVKGAWIFKDGLLKHLDTAGYDPGGNHGTDGVWFKHEGYYYSTDYSSMAGGGRRCANPDCLNRYSAPPPSPIDINGCSRSACNDTPDYPVNCVRVNADGSVPPFINLYENGTLPCEGDGLCNE